MTDINERVKAAGELGKKAFENGLMATPIRDPELRKLTVCPDPGMDNTIKILDAWSKAWHAANLAAPVVIDE